MDTIEKTISTEISEKWTSSETVFASLFFPASMLFVVFFYIFLISQDYLPIVALYLCELPVIALIILFERIFPNNDNWNKSRRDIITDIGHNLTVILSIGLLAPILYVAGMGLFNLLTPFNASGIWPSHWPLIVQLMLVLVLAEAITYWVHRLQHKIPFLWRFHSIHHSAHRLYWLNTGRFHFVDILMNAVPVILLLFAMGVEEDVYLLFALVSAVHGLFQHGNLKIRIGFLNWFFSMAELHRWHHSILGEESNHNYGQTIILWDIIFGTRYLPGDRLQPSTTGMAYPSQFPEKFIPQLLAPIQWKRYCKREQGCYTLRTGEPNGDEP